VSQIPLFFPELLSARFTPEFTDAYVNENVAEFNNLAFPVGISWLGHPDWEFYASSFTPTANSQAQKKYDGRSGNDLGVSSLPIGLSPLDVPKVKDACLQYLESLLQDSLANPLLYPIAPNTTACKKIFDLVYSFYQSSQEVSMKLDASTLANHSYRDMDFFMMFFYSIWC
jgi:hypothetical protein